MLKRIIASALAFTAAVVFAATYKFTATNSPLYAFSDKVEVFALDGSFGNGVFVTEREYPFVKNAAGESCALTGNACVGAAEIFEALGGKILFTERTEYGASYYGYSPKVKYKTSLYGKRVNVHVFEGNDTTKIGLPIIYGSY